LPVGVAVESAGGGGSRSSGATAQTPVTGSTLETLGKFEGTGFATDPVPTTPPDTQVAVGPVYVGEAVNSAVVYWSRTGTRVGQADLNPFFGVPAGYEFSDPRLAYDALASRWLLSGFASDRAFDSIVYVAISDTSDPTQPWSVYQVTARAGVLTDQPKIGFNSDKVVIAWDDYANAGSNFSGQETWILQLSQMLTGNTINIEYFAPDVTLFSVVPVLSLTATSTEYLAYNNTCSGFDGFGTGSCTTGSSSFGLVAITGTPAQSDVAWNEADPALGETSNPPSAAQPGGSPIDTNDDRFLSAVWQNGVLWAAANDACLVGGATQSCLRVTEVSTVSGVVLTDTDLGQTGADVYFPAVTLDSAGNPYVVATESSPTIDPSVVVIGATPATAGFVGSVLWFGVGSYACSFCGADGNRWGDYSGAAADPAHPQDVWVAGEHVTPASGDNWGTAIGHVTFAAPTVTGVAPPSGNSAGGTQVTITGSDFTQQATVQFGDTPAAAVTVNSDTSITATSPPLPAGVTDVTVTTSDGTSSTSVSDEFTSKSDTTAPVVTLTQPSTVTLSTHIPVAWTATDTQSGVASSDVAERHAPWNAAFGPTLSWLNGSPGTSATFVGAYANTYCFNVRARDNAANLSAWTPLRCTSVPMRATSLTYSAGWRRVLNAALFSGVGEYTATKGARISRTAVQARRVWLVATTCASCGTIQVRWNGIVIANVSLVTPTTHHQRLLTLASFASVRAGTLTLTVTSASGRSVGVEGLAVARF
jgi:hypothetical protein